MALAAVHPQFAGHITRAPAGYNLPTTSWRYKAHNLEYERASEQSVVAFTTAAHDVPVPESHKYTVIETKCYACEAKQLTWPLTPRRWTRACPNVELTK